MPSPAPSRHAVPSRHALLIGIQSYRHLPDLDGPRNDVIDFGLLLMDHFGFPDDGRHVKAHFKGEMTRDEVVAAFEDLCERVGDGDQVVVFYAGHGSWLEGDDGGVLQTLVPSDSGRPDGANGEAAENRDILDVEIDAWIGRLNEKTPHVTLIFDSCHSGDVTRDALEVSRGVPPDRLARRPDARAALATRSETDVATRSLSGRGSLTGLVLARRSALVLAACRADETAKERVVGSTPHGVFSYELIRALKQLPAGATWRSAFERVASRVTSRYASQHPQIEGSWDTLLFGSDEVRPRPYLPVRQTRYRDERDLFLLGGGVAHGAVAGSLWDLYPSEAMAPDRKSETLLDGRRPVRVSIEHVAAGASVARRVPVDDDPRREVWVEEGFRAFPVGGSAADDLRSLSGRSLLDLEPPAGSPLVQAVSMRVLRLGESESIEVEPEPGDGLPRAAWGEALDVEITNHHDAPVWTTLLAIETHMEGGTDSLSFVQIVWPDRRHENYQPDGVRLEPGQTLSLARDHHPGIAELDRPGLRWLPPAEVADNEEAMVHLRLMATTAPMDFSYLAQGPHRASTRDAGLGFEDGLDDDLAWTFEQRSLVLDGARRAEASPERVQSELVAAVMRRKQRAAVIGIDAYTNGITPLHTASSDATAVAKSLEAQGYEVDLLRDREAGRDSLLAELARLTDEVDEDTALLVYFAGHGVALDDGTPTPRGYLLPADASRLDESTWLSMSVVQSLLDRLRCRHLMLVLDCCFAGSFRWTATRDAGVAGPIFESQLHRYFRGKAWQLLTSASHNERALDFPPGSGNPRDPDAPGRRIEDNRETAHSPFAAALLEGLAGRADTEFAGEQADGIITASELYQFLRHRLVLDSAQAWQTPGLSPLRPDSTGEFFFVTPGREPKPSENPPREASNPWLGLSAYTRRDHERFFGREREIGALCDKIRSEKLVVVTGASGSGKSSLVRAGLVPKLQASDPPWSVAPSMRFRRPDPTAQFEEVVASLDLGDDRPGLVVLDQAEELFIRFDVVQQKRLLTRLSELIDRTSLHVVVTIRSDFEPQLRSAVVRAARFTRAFFPVPPPAADDLRRIVEGPAHLYGFYFGVVESEESGGYGAEPAPSASLVDQIVGEVMSMPGALPQLSFALSEMYEQAWKRWSEDDPDRAFQPEDFEEVGGVVGSIHFIASKIYESASEEKQRLIRWMFLRMVTEAGGRLARRRVDERELRRADAPENELLREALAEYQAAGLITSDEGFVEPGHDTLVTAWPDLLRWLGEAEALTPDLQQDLRAIWEAARAWADAEGEVTPKKRRRMLWHDDLRTETFADVAGLRGRLLRRFWHVGRTERLEIQRAERQALRFHLSALELRFIDASASRCRWLRRLRWAWILLVGAVLWLGVEALWPLAMRQFAPYLADYFDRIVELTNEIGWFVGPSLGDF